MGALGVSAAFLFFPLAALLGLFSPVAWFIGRNELKSIDEGRRDPTKRTAGRVGMVLGVVGTIFAVFGNLLALLAITRVL